MRPLRLDLAGFAAFREEATVDFTDADFFALVGPTGSGKSTVLEAICFALYGRMPRWGDARTATGALAPSAVEARVRLAFETAGERFVATRVVRRDGKGRVKTSGAGLQRMPAGFDVRKFDTGLTPDDLGEVLAGTPTEMDRAVPEVVGLPYEQFVTCVVLPQGEFAEFLHAKPATRQQILVNLLSLSVYEEIRERAVGRATAAEAELAAADRLLADLADTDDAALARADSAYDRGCRLVEAVETELPRLAQARTALASAEAELRRRDEDAALLAELRPPPTAATVAEAVSLARTTLTAATAAVTAAEEHEEKERSALAGAGDPTTLRLLLADQEERDRVTAQHAAVAEAVATARAEAEAAVAAVTRARAEATAADAALEAAREAYARAQTADRAGALRAHLVSGEPCPVCTQPVAAVPAMPADSAVATAEAAGKTARAEAEAARGRLRDREEAARALDRTLATAAAQEDALRERRDALAAKLADAPPAEVLHRDLATVAAAQERLDQASGQVKRARTAYRRARADADAAEQQLGRAWRDLDAARDRVARLAPPPVDRDDLAAAWTALADWAAGQADRLRADRVAQATAVETADAAVTAAADRLAGHFADADVPPPADDGYARAAAVAAERARAERDRLRQRRRQADELRDRRADHEREAQVARALATHLRANNFEAWLLAEALDRLVEGASAILRELTGGQYDLVHEKREFYVVDHHDAGLRRGVRTLSGGETFQASLALALALSEQLAGLATASASLESIMLDEGFGSLDAATLDTVAATLENLAARGDRMVGVVTHVPALAERIPVKFELHKDARSARVTRVGL